MYLYNIVFIASIPYIFSLLLIFLIFKRKIKFVERIKNAPILFSISIALIITISLFVYEGYEFFSRGDMIAFYTPSLLLKNGENPYPSNVYGPLLPVIFSFMLFIFEHPSTIFIFFTFLLIMCSFLYEKIANILFGDRKKNVVALILSLNPIVWHNTLILMQGDDLFVLFSNLIIFYMFLKKKFFKASMFSAITSCVKIPSMFFFLFLSPAIRDKNKFKVSVFLFFFIFLFIHILSIFFWGYKVIEPYIFHGKRVYGSTAKILKNLGIGINYPSISLLFLIFIPFFTWKIKNILSTSALSIIFFILTPLVYPEYYMWFLPFVMLFALKNKDTCIFYLSLLLVLISRMFQIFIHRFPVSMQNIFLETILIVISLFTISVIVNRIVYFQTTFRLKK